MKTTILVIVCTIGLAGCANMSNTQQRALSGTAIGAGGGAILGAIGGNAALGAVAGAGVGLIGGLIYDDIKKNEHAQYQQGYYAGQQSGH
jgi:osmotically inducible lipoprotein OsmB